MRMDGILAKAALLAAFLLALSWGGPARAVVVNLVSDTTWTVTDSAGQDLGLAQAVCLNATTPPTCPAGATVYGYPFGGWLTDTSMPLGAQWIWAPGVTGQTAPAGGATFTFRNIFYLCDTPTGGTISVAADNDAEVSVNGTPVLSVHSHSTLQVAAVPASLLVTGYNVVEITASNAANPADCGSGLYQCNPAGLLVGASFQDPLPEWPSCQGVDGPVPAGKSEDLDCPLGQTGTRTHQCLCVRATAFWSPVTNACMTPSPPKTCRSPKTGTSYEVNDSEIVKCVAPETGTQSRVCLADGTFGPLTGACTPPTCHDPITGKDFQVDQTQFLSCATPLTGSQTRVCLSDGTFGPVAGACVLPTTTAGATCGSRTEGQTALCPAETTCRSRVSRGRKPPAWCIPAGFLFPPILLSSECQGSPDLLSTDWYCDP